MTCLQSLFLSNPQDDLARSAKEGRVDGTCEWILTQDLYTSWLIEDSPQLLWLSGGPGIGKTMISSFLVKELAQLAAERSSQMTLAYYFCDDKDERRRTATAILRGLILQLLRQRPVLFKHIQPDFDISRDRLFTDFYALRRIFDNIVKDPEAGEVYCLIDALDECEKESRQLFLVNFIKLFSSQQSKKTVIKFIVTSRGENDIKESLVTADPAIQNLQIDSGRVNDDLSKFINVKVDELSKKKGYQPKQKDMIKHALTEKAGGTFLYISLVVQDLAKTKIFSQVRKKLQELPSDLNKVYDRILRQIDAECEEIETAKLILRWVAVARRPLTVDELAMARALGQGEWEKNTIPPKDLLDELRDGFRSCEPLVYVDTDKDTVNLVHQSAKDYLLGTYLQGKNGLSQYHIVTDWTNLLIFRTCWIYLSLEEFKQGTVIIERDTDHRLRQTSLSKHCLYDHCFLRYADQEWQEHALAASRALATGYEFRKDNLDRLPTLRDTWLLRAAADGQEVVVQRLLENGAELNSKDEYSRTPLSWAAQKGHEKVVQMLLDKRADINAQGEEYDNALQAASYGGHGQVVQMLLDKGADVNAQGGYYGNALQAASYGGHDQLVQMLLDKGAEYGNALHAAALKGHGQVVQMLLDKGADVNAQGGYYDNALQAASYGGHGQVVQMLLHKGADVNAQGGEYGNALQAASYGDHGQVVQMLLDKGADINAQGGEYGNALQAALYEGHDKVVQMLLNHDAIVNWKDTQGRTPIHLASAEGRMKIVEILSSFGADLTVVDTQGRDCLHHAASQGSIEIVNWLLKKGFDPNYADRDGWTSLHWAAKNGSVDTIKVLKAAGARSTIETIEGWTPDSVSIFHQNNPSSTSLAAAVESTDYECKVRPGIWHVGCYCDGCLLVSFDLNNHLNFFI